jgi:hypothetical protein
MRAKMSLVPILVLFLVAPLLAEKSMGMECGMKKGMEGMHSEHWMNPHHISMVFKYAEKKVEGDLKDKVRSLRTSSMEKILRQKAEVDIARMRVKDLMEDPSFNGSDLKKAIRNLKDAEYQFSTLCVDALMKLRDLIGLDLFKEVTTGCPKEKMMKMQMQMKSQGMKMHHMDDDED